MDTSGSCNAEGPVGYGNRGGNTGGNGGGGGNSGNPGKDNDDIHHPGPRSTLLPDFEVFTVAPWNPYPSPKNPVDWILLQQYCNRQYGRDVQCGVFRSEFGTSTRTNFSIDAFGFRLEASGWLDAGGGDINIDVLYFGRSNETGVFVSPGGQGGAGGGIAITGGILFGNNMPNRGSYGGPSYSMGGDIPLVLLGTSIELEKSISSPNPDGTLPVTTYLGGGPLQPEAGGYAGANVSIPISDIWRRIFGK